ncbi:MAG: YnbE family lipoprotein [Gammaproteobacteria bacterium]|nr:YnbE family lipoprotein [Gammaproteobacteria bacterium]
MKICDCKAPILLCLTGLWLAGCVPTVKVEAPEKPIEINMNVKIEHEIRIKVEQDIDALLTQKPGLF